MGGAVGGLAVLDFSGAAGVGLAVVGAAAGADWVGLGWLPLAVPPAIAAPLLGEELVWPGAAPLVVGTVAMDSRLAAKGSEMGTSPLLPPVG